MTSFSAFQVANMLRTGGTQRYHTHAADLVKTQDVAQHSYNVFLLIFALTRGKASTALLTTAVMHDAGERWTGDVPAPTKRTLKLRTVFSDLEAAALFNSTGLTPPDLSPFEVKVLSAADSLEGLRFCYNERQLGNRLIDEMMRNFADYTIECLAYLPELPEFDRSLANTLFDIYTEPLYARK